MEDEGTGEDRTDHRVVRDDLKVEGIVVPHYVAITTQQIVKITEI